MLASPDLPVSGGLFPLLGKGFFGEPALLAHSETTHFFQFRLEEAQSCERSLALTYRDPDGGLQVRLTYALHAGSGVLQADASLTNGGETVLTVQRLNAITLPLPGWATQIEMAYGSWSNEGHPVTLPLNAGKFERTGRSGRPGFDGGPLMIVTEDEFTESQGHAIGLALAHSGNFTIAAERFGDGRGQIFAAEWLQPGEITLEPGASYTTPGALAALSTHGRTELSRRFHRHARTIAPKTRAHRPVQFNTWEAVYFDVDETTAMRLADEAAMLGAERFVLDDGWFKGRHDDTTSLGDWQVDDEKFPSGLKPLAAHVESLGMELGLWLEPEMVSEDSNLYRRHPDWILSVPGWPRPTGRNQLVLDLSREDVRQYLFDTIDGLLTRLSIGYLKWDCNRDLFPAASAGRASTRHQIDGFYDLMDRLRMRHPDLSIESCASGGGRMDFGVLSRVDRFWPSDATDALERVRIQRTASTFFPLETLGAHVGPSPNPWTRRRFSMAFRCFVALFGHFGMELNPAGLSETDRDVLRRAVEVYKHFRPLIIEGRLMRFNSDEGLDVQAVVAEDESTVLLRVLRVHEPTRPLAAPIRLPGLATDTTWTIDEIFLTGENEKLPIGRQTSQSLALVGLDAAPGHAAQGRLLSFQAVNP